MFIKLGLGSLDVLHKLSEFSKKEEDGMDRGTHVSATVGKSYRISSRYNP